MSDRLVAAALVRWVDSAKHQDDFDGDHAPDVVEVVSVGHLVYRGPDRLVLALNRSYVDDADPYGMAIAIPTAAIVEVRELELEEER